MNTFAYMSTKKQPTIPMHRMDANTPFGMQFGYYETDSKYAENTKSEKYIAHRDDYYLFLFIDTEETILTIDFEDIRIQGEQVFYVRPGQVHTCNAKSERIFFGYRPCINRKSFQEPV